ncbi:MAG TPA: hypothetical protein PLC15_11415 [Candidatus Obscuribacter sp.]|nr:hypothetical protein [Candidatus Obscuribacter sp.]MBK9282560.1 hypothetical protein [Candidatus Obscuribacter sp.]MBL8084848.1 hypothetical protein [Candidatus Obscuribacter sp.]HMW91213.1 hypothetical protein [Candidatus Obscuribacter sp.]HMY51815.1 hypothetical protein [Candidatus Obscuribacter sp.]
MKNQHDEPLALPDKQAVRLYHCMPLSGVSYGVLLPDPAFSDTDFLPAYRWAEERLGFFPLFLAVGPEEAVSMTGYVNQWQRYIGTERKDDGTIANVYRRKGEFPNNVLFVFGKEAVAAHEAVFTDYMAWHIVLNETMNQHLHEAKIGVQAVRSLFKKSWSMARWYNHSRKALHDVQLLVPRLDLRQAQEVWVRNKSTARKLKAMGFANVKVKRLPVER